MVLFDDLGNQIETVLHRRSAGLKLGTPIGLGDSVLSKPLVRVQGMGHRRHIRGIDGIHPPDEVEDVRELLGGAGCGFIAHLETCQVGNARYLVPIDGQGSNTREEGWLTPYVT